MTIPYEKLYKHVEPVLDSKIDEFRYYEYNAISKKDLWQYCVDKKWRKQNVEALHLHEVVATIYSVSSSELVNYAQISDMKQQQLNTHISQEELELLLNHMPVTSETELD
jgi:hypothetical protein